MKKKLIGILPVLFVAACTATQQLQPATIDLAAAQQRVPGITLDELQSGYKIFARNCSACHRLHNPNEYTATRWHPILDTMFTKAKMTKENERELVRNYVLVNCR